MERRRNLQGEDEIVKRIEQAFRGDRAPVRPILALGPGDDAAILKPPRGQEIVLSVDASLEGVHFLDNVHPPESVGYKSLARAASDLAAMGAQPLCFLLQIGLPLEKTGEWLDGFLRGMRSAARELRLVLAGGDTSRFPTVTISITVIGAVRHGEAVTRVSSIKAATGGRRPIELLCVSGPLGGAQLGLELVRHGVRWATADRNTRRLLRPHMFPRIPMALAQWLAAEKIPSAMMDISDGLSTDLARLCAANGRGALLWEKCIPRVAIPAAFRGLGFDPLELALHGGEDYALLFTLPVRRRHRLYRSHWAGQIKEIGILVNEPGIHLAGEPGEEKPLEAGGWDPFSGSREQRDTNSG